MKVKQFKTGENFLDDSSQFWLVTSDNLDNFPIGSLIKSSTKIRVKGEMLGRIIPLTNSEWLINTKNKNTAEMKSLFNFKSLFMSI